MLLNTLQCAGLPPPPTRNYLNQNVNSAEVEKPALSRGPQPSRQLTRQACSQRTAAWALGQDSGPDSTPSAGTGEMSGNPSVAKSPS